MLQPARLAKRNSSQSRFVRVGRRQKAGQASCLPALHMTHHVVRHVTHRTRCRSRAVRTCPTGGLRVALEERSVVAVRRVRRDLAAQRDLLNGGSFESGRTLHARGLRGAGGVTEGRGRSRDLFFHDPIDSSCGRRAARPGRRKKRLAAHRSSTSQTSRSFWISRPRALSGRIRRRTATSSFRSRA